MRIVIQVTWKRQSSGVRTSFFVFQFSEWRWTKPLILVLSAEFFLKAIHLFCPVLSFSSYRLRKKSPRMFTIHTSSCLSLTQPPKGGQCVESITGMSAKSHSFRYEAGFSAKVPWPLFAMGSGTCRPVRRCPAWQRRCPLLGCARVGWLLRLVGCRVLSLLLSWGLRRVWSAISGDYRLLLSSL